MKTATESSASESAPTVVAPRGDTSSPGSVGSRRRAPGREGAAPEDAVLPLGRAPRRRHARARGGARDVAREPDRRGEHPDGAAEDPGRRRRLPDGSRVAAEGDAAVGGRGAGDQGDLRFAGRDPLGHRQGQGADPERADVLLLRPRRASSSREATGPRSKRSGVPSARSPGWPSRSIPGRSRPRRSGRGRPSPSSPRRPSSRATPRRARRGSSVSSRRRFPSTRGGRGSCAT